MFGKTPRKHADWSHRRGEPRALALAWTLFLLLTLTLVALHNGAGRSPDAMNFELATREALLVVVAGMCVLWPMVRLSQVRPAAGGIACASRDLVIILLPAQPIIWPSIWLTRWSVGVVTAIGAVVLAWGLVIGLLLACALGRRRIGSIPGELNHEGAPMSSGSRGAWLALIIAAPLLGLIPALAVGDLAGATAHLDNRPSWMLNPFTAILEVTRDRSWLGGRSGLSGLHWLLIAATGLVATTGWILLSAVNGLFAAAQAQRHAQ
ncbi:MAG: hypothetical protein H6811_06675 [Phycisphaeraceae bacterium]|nr:hypothetical protein [Phycisphaeraceae bacterium]